MDRGPSTPVARPPSHRSSQLTLHVCGDFAATVDDREVPLGGPRQKAVLARVLVGEGDVVSAEQVVADVWGERSIESTVASVHAYVSRLRRLLGPAALPHTGGGYVLDRRVVTIDADEFVADVARGRRASARGDDAAAEDLIETALARWSGPSAFGAMRDAHFLGPAAARLEELRVVAGETLADARARCGRAADDVALLEELAARDPLRESLAVRLVRALYAAGRQADALAAFERCRRALADQLGVDPAPPLRAIHAAVLAQLPVPLAGGTVLPTHLPPRNRSFVGRAALLDLAATALDDDGRRPRAVALTGLGGVGKTELALELAHRRLRSSRVAWWVAAEDPAATAAALGDLAAALGITPFERGEDTRAALWAELDRTPGWIVVFDNADEPSLLEPFLPAARHGDVVITSRNPAWRRLARTLPVPPLQRAESVAYVTARTGPSGTPGDDHGHAAELAELLGDLPLALEQASAYVEQTGMSLPDYVRLFRARRDSLLLRDAGGSRPTVAATWGLAFDRLRARSARAAELLETLAFLSPDAVAVELLGPLAADELDLQDLLAELLRLSLVDRDTGVLRMHRLVQDVVRARLPVELRHRRLAAAAGLCTAPAAADAVAAHLVSVAAHAEELGVEPAGLVAALSRLATHYAGRALYPAAEHVLEAALRLHAVTTGGEPDPAGRGELLCRLGEVLDAAGRLGPALELHRDAVEILTVAPDPDPVVLAHAHNRLGHVLNCADDAPAAIDAHERALRVLRGAGLDDLTAPVLIDLGYTLWGVGRLDDAGESFRAGRSMLERRGGREHRDWAHATAGLGLVEQDAGRVAEAVELQRTAIVMFTRVCGPDHPDTAQALDKLGYGLRLQGHTRESVDAHRRALLLLERVLGADDSRVGMAGTNLGLAYADDGRLDRAVATQTRARDVLLAALGPEHGSTILASDRLADALARSGRTGRPRPVPDELVAGRSVRA